MSAIWIWVEKGIGVCGEGGEVLHGGDACRLHYCDLSEAWNDLGSITGETMDEELIHSIFSQFCVGK